MTDTTRLGLSLARDGGYAKVQEYRISTCRKNFNSKCTNKWNLNGPLT